MPEQQRVSLDCAIVGGGISGLTAAHSLHTRGPELKVGIFERKNRFGGILHTRNENGFLFETSADSFITDPPAALELCEQLGLADQLLSTRASGRGAQVLFEGRLMPVPAGFQIMGPRRLWPLITSPLLSWKGKLRACCEPWIPRRKGQADESLAAFATRRLGKEVFERLVAPLVGGIYTADPEQLSMEAALPRFVAMEQNFGSLYRGMRARARKDRSKTDESAARYSLFAAPRNGIEQMLRTLREQLPEDSLHVGTTVTELAPSQEHAWELVTDNENRYTARHLILATPAFAAADLIEACEPELAGELRKIPYAGCAVACLGYAKNQFAKIPLSFGMVVPPQENRQILAASFSSNKFAGRCPDDHLLIRVFLGGAGREAILEKNDEEIVATAHNELAELLSIRGVPTCHQLSRWERSMPQYHVGHAQLVAGIENRVSRAVNLTLIGNAYHGVGIPQCIDGAVRAAEAICGKESA